jgi:hypothetical protein
MDELYAGNLLAQQVECMKSIFNNLPLNTLNVFAMATAPDGCQVYIPVNSTDQKVIEGHKRALQIELNARQPNYQPNPPPRSAA